MGGEKQISVSYPPFCGHSWGNVLQAMSEELYLAIKTWLDVSAFFRKQIWKCNRKLTKLRLLDEKWKPQFFLNVIDMNKYYFLNNSSNIIWLKSKERHFPKVTHYSSGKSDSHPFSSMKILLEHCLIMLKNTDLGENPSAGITCTTSLSGCSDQ